LMQIAEPVRVPWNAQHWIDMLINDKYVIATEDAKIDRANLANPDAETKKGMKSIWEATNGNLDSMVLGMLQSVDSIDSQYLYRYFKELFSEYGWVLEDAYNHKKAAEQTQKTPVVAKDTFKWIFGLDTKTEIIGSDSSGKNISEKVTKAIYEPYAWTANTMGTLIPKSEDKVYGFDKELDVISPVTGVVISKTDKTKNELGQVVPSSITIEVRGSGDKNADGMRVVIIGVDLTATTGSTVTQGSVIGKTGTDRIKIMVLSKNDNTQLSNICDFLKPPREVRESAEAQSVINGK